MVHVVSPLFFCNTEAQGGRNKPFPFFMPDPGGSERCKDLPKAAQPGCS